MHCVFVKLRTSPSYLHRDRSTSNLLKASAMICISYMTALIHKEAPEESKQVIRMYVLGCTLLPPVMQVLENILWALDCHHTSSNTLLDL